MNALEITEVNDVVVVSFNHSKVLDEATIRQIGEEFSTLTLEAAAERKLLLNFSNVAFMASAMIGKILVLNKQCKKDRVDLKLCSICPNIMEVFNLMKLNKVLKIYDNAEQALEAFGPTRKSWFHRS
ncbi:MAG: STAS domain-containing protein [Pirellulales bacterium]|nr:STAS domain-containing protein [Pirellulales bacterium]